MSSRHATARLFAANLGGWLAIMPAAVVTIALRLREFDSSGLPSQYSLILASGWLALIVCLILAGQLSDMLHARTGSRLLLTRISIPLLVLLSFLLAYAPTPGWLSVWWVLIQIPVGLIITTTLAASGELVPLGRRGAISGLIGASSIIALFLGTAIADATGDAQATSMWLPAVIGAALCLPYAILHRATARDLEASIDRSVSMQLPAVGPWLLFIAASLLLSWATSTTNGYLVLLVDHVSTVADDAVASTSTRLVLIASSAAIFASLLLGPLARTRRISAWLWSGSAMICGLALILLIARTGDASLAVSALLFGLAFGAANGVELALVLFLRSGSPRLGRDLGIFTSATTVPYALVPALGAVMLSDDVRAGLMQLFGIAAALAIIAAALTLVIAQRRATA